ncbi:hypothetical protein [Roseinatronobacter monicus]|uniref:Uncharacterized protein n=1 Tax=Roseinatronobacter monicus TaxID=393481 RepID=A0A543K5N0_9RHOB|nr:hypothetical protein [Roseinatronobacter monicus]TQM90387.1 hypothetical protein BD293_3766 [Roseinatronobacter monicus]
MSNTFPFGNELSQAESWLGHMNAKSTNWYVFYDGGLSVICGYHSFIFLGLESLTIAVVRFYGCGVSVGLPVGKLFGAAGANARAARRVEHGHGIISNAYDVASTIEMEQAQRSAGEGMALYQRMQSGYPNFMQALQPFSLSDLAGMSGAVAGAHIELGAAAGSYIIEGGVSPVYFRKSIVNTGDGLVNAGLGMLSGVWSVERWYNLYLELGASAQASCAIKDQIPGYAQPYRQIADVHPIIAQLPPAGCSISETEFNPASLLPQ